MFGIKYVIGSKWSFIWTRTNIHDKGTDSKDIIGIFKVQRLVLLRRSENWRLYLRKLLEIGEKNNNYVT